MKKLIPFSIVSFAIYASALNCVQTEFEIRKNEYEGHGYAYSTNYDGYSIGGANYVFAGEIPYSNLYKESKYYYTGTHLDSALFPFAHFGYLLNGVTCSIEVTPDGNEISSCPETKPKYTAHVLDYKFEAESEDELLTLLNEYYLIAHFENITQISGDNPKTITRQFFEHFKNDETPKIIALYVYKNGKLQSTEKNYKYTEKIVHTATIESIEDSVHMDIKVTSYENGEEKKQDKSIRTLSLRNDTLYISDGEWDYDKTIIVQDEDSKNRCYTGKKENPRYVFQIEIRNDTLIRTEYNSKGKWTYLYAPVQNESATSIQRKFRPAIRPENAKHFDLLGRPAQGKYTIVFLK